MHKEIFTDIYRKNKWFSFESKSGTGSTLKETEKIRKELPKLFNKYNIKTLCDAPCGDLNWMKVFLKDNLTLLEEYTGLDIVEEIIDKNKKMNLNIPTKINFEKADLLCDKLPEADCILIRDCFVHLPNNYIMKALNNIKNSRIKYLLTTSYHNKVNLDTHIGGWRKINLEKKPFYLKGKIDFIIEDSKEMFGLFKDKSLVLFEIDRL